MMKRLFFVIALLFVAIVDVCAWGQKGHDIVAYIAECNLEPEVKAKVESALGGMSMVYWSNWADSSRYTDEYKHTGAWHYLNVEEGETLESTKRSEKGDVVKAVKDLTAQLKKGGLTAKEEGDALKFLIHFVGDLHCPMHAGRYADLGGNRIPVTFFHSSTNIHSVWDTKLIEVTHAWDYMGWQRELDREAMRRDIKVDSTPEEWFEETHKVAVSTYDHIKKKDKLSFDFRDKYQADLERQLLSGGLRLATLLNEIY